MAIEKHFIEENVKKLIIRKFTEEELSKVGCGEVNIYRTPLGIRISIYAEKPGLVIGRKGKTIHKLTETFVTDFKLENPQLEVQQIEKPELNAPLMAQKIAGALERGIHFRRAVYATMKRIRGAGALGCEVTVSGKVTGGRARMSKFIDGFIKHAGEQKNEYVQEGYAQALLKAGVLGVKVTIVPPDANLKEISYIGETPPELEPLTPEAKEAGAEKPEAAEKAEKAGEAGKEAEKQAETKKENVATKKGKPKKGEKKEEGATGEKKGAPKAEKKTRKKTTRTTKRAKRPKAEVAKGKGAKTEEEKAGEVKDGDTQS